MPLEIQDCVHASVCYDTTPHLKHGLIFAAAMNCERPARDTNGFGVAINPFPIQAENIDISADDIVAA